VPFAYAQHIKTFVVLFCFTVPFAKTETMRWYTPIASGLLAFALFGIDEIGVEIEDPFGCDENDLPLDDILATILEDATGIVEASCIRPAQ
jgi:ion channel-forming bestrophin family protein